MQPTLTETAVPAADSPRILSDPGLIRAQNRFLEVVARLWMEAAYKRARLALERAGYVVLYPPEVPQI